MLIEWVLGNDLLQYLFGIGLRDDDTTCAGHFPAAHYKYVCLVVLLQVLYMCTHMLIQLFKRHDVVEADDEHDLANNQISE